MLRQMLSVGAVHVFRGSAGRAENLWKLTRHTGFQIPRKMSSFGRNEDWSATIAFKVAEEINPNLLLAVADPTKKESVLEKLLNWFQDEENLERATILIQGTELTDVEFNTCLRTSLYSFRSWCDLDSLDVTERVNFLMTHLTQRDLEPFKSAIEDYLNRNHTQC